MKRAFIILSLLTSVVLSLWSAEATFCVHGFQAMPGDTVQLSFTISSNEDITSFEADLALPIGLSMIDSTTNPKNTFSDHILGIRRQSDGKALHIACWSPTNAVINGPIRLTIAIDANMEMGNYLVSMSDVLLVTSDGVSLPLSDQKANIEINDTGYTDHFAALFSDAPISQAWILRNTDTRFNLQLSHTTGKITLEAPNDGSDCQHFFIEPAYDQDEDLYYLRSAEGYYLCATKNGNSYTLGVAQFPSSTSALILTATGDRTYALTIADSEWRLAASGSKAGEDLSLSKNKEMGDWQLFPCNANHITYFERLYEVSALFIGLTKNQSDFDFRKIRHDIRGKVDQGMDDEHLAANIHLLHEAVTTVRHSYATDDSTFVVQPWGEAEVFTSAERYITTIADDGKPRFLTFSDGKLILTDQFSPLEAEDTWLKDAYYNLYTDRYAIRLEGPDTDQSGRYLVLNEMTGAVTDTLISTLSESLACWSVLSLSQAMQRYLELSGRSGTYVNWDFNPTTGTLTFFGQLRTHTYVTPEARPWHLYRHLIRHVVFSGKISLLGANLLNGCTHLESLTFVTATKPVPADGTFTDVPAGIDIFAPNPDEYKDYLPDCKTHFLVHLQETYEYDGTNQAPWVEGIYDAEVTAGVLEKDVGTYTSIFTIVINIDGKACEYTGPFTYTILPAPLTLAARDYSRAYGSKNPNLHVSVNGLKGADTEKSVFSSSPIVVVEADEKSTVGTYPILAMGGTLANSNYVLSYQHAMLTVRPKTLSIIADDKTCYQGESHPVFTYSCIGFVNGDDESVLTQFPVLSCEADSTSEAGKYPISISGGVAHNYSIVTANGILTILEGTDVDFLREKDEKGTLSTILDLCGRPIHVDGESSQCLPEGLYIINGKKKYIHQ